MKIDNYHTKIDVSIVIVCMNNLRMLYPCLESIKKYTSCSYEVLVTAYLFTPENLKKVRDDYPWVTFIESNEIRGFSENNNLALKKAKGRYCFVLNDDTEMKMDVVGGLLETIENLPDEVALVSPATYFGNGQIQSCGRPPHTTMTFVKDILHLWREQKVKSPYTYQKGVFQSYDIVGAAFMIKTDVFEAMGWFDERYFFCPEDIALSTKVNKAGFKAYVNADIHLIHYEGMSGGTSVSMVKTATAPAASRGSLIFYSRCSKMLYFFLGSLIMFVSICGLLFHYMKYLLTKKHYNHVYAIVNYNIMCSVFTRLTPKEIFIKYYKAIK